MEAALDDYLTAYFKGLYPELDTDPVDGAPQFLSASVGVASMAPITSDNARRNLQQRSGTQFDVETTLRFQDGIFPEYGELESNMQDAMFNNFDVFLADYLFFYGTPDLANIDSGTYISGFTTPPEATDNPTAAPSASIGGSISQINESVPVNAQDGDGINPLYPAIGCGVVMFVLTALFLSYRRKRLLDMDVSTDDSDIEHISVDFDGRQEAVELERERQLQYQKEQQMIHEQQEREMLQQQQQLEAQRKKNNNKRKNKFGWSKSKVPVEKIQMEDGRTTIHIAPVIPDEDSEYDQRPDEDDSVYDRRRGELPMIFNVASSMSHESFHDDHDNDFMRTYTSDSGEHDSSASSNIYQPYGNGGGRRPLPSMSRGGATFGAGGQQDMRRGYA